MNLQTILNILLKVGPVIAAAPEFKALFDEVVSTFSDDRDQAELKAAYELAISNAADAHTRLQELVARNG